MWNSLVHLRFFTPPTLTTLTMTLHYRNVSFLIYVYIDKKIFLTQSLFISLGFGLKEKFQCLGWMIFAVLQ